MMPNSRSIHAGGLQNRSGLFAIGVSLMGALCGLACQGPEEYRIDFSEFRQLQRQFATPTPQPAPTDPQTGTFRVDRALGPYRVGPGDVLTITLMTSQEGAVLSPVTARIRKDGSVRLPLNQSVGIEGKTLEEVEDAIRESYSRDVITGDLLVNATMVSFQTTEVLVVGAVAFPGVANLQRHQRDMLHAVVAAGGVTAGTSGKAILERIRDPSQRVIIDLTKPVELEAALALDPLEDGDVITVAAAEPNRIYLGGLLLAAGPQDYPAGVRVTYLQAVAAAGGLRPDLMPKGGTLVRRMPDGRDVHVKLDLERLARGEDENFYLAAGDVLWVPYTNGLRWKEYLQQNIRLGGGFSVNYDPIQFENTQRALRQQSDQFGGGNNFSNSINSALRFGLNGAFFPPN